MTINKYQRCKKFNIKTERLMQCIKLLRSFNLLIISDCLILQLHDFFSKSLLPKIWNLSHKALYWLGIIILSLPNPLTWVEVFNRAHYIYLHLGICMYRRWCTYWGTMTQTTVSNFLFNFRRLINQVNHIRLRKLQQNVIQNVVISVKSTNNLCYGIFRKPV